MHRPLLYEINTRCWLRDLSAQQGRSISLADVPASEIRAWQDLGFSHIWLMGVWTTGPRARARALTNTVLRAAYSEVLPSWKEEDIGASPYAIAEYKVAEELGGESGLEVFRQHLKEANLRLVLDFVPNHLGLDSPWIWERPELFVQAENSTPETLRQSTATGTVWLAHGRDPNFPAWSDTVQLDYRRAATRSAMTQLLQSVADRCDGVRCDMAMLLLNEVFGKTWSAFPAAESTPTEEFWATAISTVKQRRPEFICIAEAYWGLERQLQELGFDYTYDKALYDKLIARQPAALQRYLLDSSKEKPTAEVRFLENHDEPRIAALLSPAEHRAAAVVLLGLPGMPLLYEGQLTGARTRIPVQLLRRTPEPANPEIQRVYDQLLSVIQTSAVGNGQCEILPPRPAWPGNPSGQNFILAQWRTPGPEFDLVVVNLAPHRSQCYAPLVIPDSACKHWHMKDLLGQEEYVRFTGDLQAHGLYLDLPPNGAQLFRFAPRVDEKQP